MHFPLSVGLIMTKTTNQEALNSQTLNPQVEQLDYLRRILLAPIYDTVVETDLTPLTKLSVRLNNQLYLKREDQQPVHSFKLRGACNKLSTLTDTEKSNGVIAASAGNHAQGLALAASKLSIKATIVMPKTTPDIKVDNVRRFGAEVRLVGNSFNEAQTAAVEYAIAENKTLVHPFDDADIIVGQGTVAKELLQQLPNADVAFIPVGGGGLLAGMAVYLKQLSPSTRIVGVEAEDSACLKAALEAGKPVDLEQVGLFADGVAVKRIGQNTFDLIQKYCDEVITVSTDEICASIKDIFEQTRVIAEPAGALSLAGLQKYCAINKIENQSLVAVLSGANMNFHSLRYVSERCELGENKEAVFAVSINEEKGSFKRFCQSLHGRAITEFNYRYSGKAQANIFVGIRLSGEAKAREVLVEDLQKHNEKVLDLTDNELAKLHVRYMVGGKSVNEPGSLDNERLFRFQFPEHPGALEKFLDAMGEHWNITLFHYRNHGAAFGQVLAGFNVKKEQENEFFSHLDALGYQWQEESDNLAYQSFLKD
jgi:threonine dehydratase